jgi:hypothetical protein
VRWWTRLRHLREEWLTREGSRRRLGGGAHGSWADGAAGGVVGRASGHWGVVEELTDGAVTLEKNRRGDAYPRGRW